MANSYTNTALLDRNRPRKVVFYGRVSTEHEAQMSALGNQMQWYDDVATRFPNWTVVDKYIDEGITGTQARKRPSFMKMVKDSKADKFDLIVTREVCRFARNTVDTLTYTRELRNIGVEVYFVDDNIWTLESDGELRLSIMATLAQEESRKVSDRVKAGQAISRQNGTLYGCGNILGYYLKRNIDEKGNWNPSENTYIINPEQAETVRMIFKMYAEKMGGMKIAKELTKEKRLNASGIVKWDAGTVMRILGNATYKGYIGYNKSRSNNYLDQKRVVNHDRDSYIYKKGNFEPIISEEQWDKCNDILKSRRKVIGKDTKGNDIVNGVCPSADLWSNKLKCTCGAKFRKNIYHKNTDGSHTYCYLCYNQINNGKAVKRAAAGLDTEGYCDNKLDNNRFEWIVRLSESTSAAAICCVGGRKNKATATIEGVSPLTYTYDFCIIDLRELKKTCRSGGQDRLLLSRSSHSQIALTWDFTVTYEMARAWRKAHGAYLRQGQWQDLTMRICLDVGLMNI